MELWKVEEEWEKNKKKIGCDLKTIFDEINMLQKIKVEYDGWVKENQRIEDEKGLLVAWKEWNDKTTTLTNEKNLYENRIKWEDYHKELETNGLLFERIGEYENAVKERNEWQDIVLSIQWLKKKDELIDLSTECSRLQKEIVLLEAKTQGALERARLIKRCRDSLLYIQQRMSMLQKLVAVFVGDKGFKSWVYNTEIAPLIQNEVNAFLAPLEDFKFVIQYHNGAMLYSLDDRGNNPTLDHASGYQRFIIGIAMRIALSRIGAIGQNIRHLFIDEGFVACDSTNLQKVETILQSMMEMGGYRSVLLMSHLDAIREIAHTRIDIQRSEDDLFSKITWGKSYPTFQKNKKAELLASTTPITKRNRVKKIS
jgi:DNA repair exonuclease SbcCD ATPase subunit